MTRHRSSKVQYSSESKVFENDRINLTTTNRLFCTCITWYKKTKTKKNKKSSITQLLMSRMCTSLTLSGLCLPPNRTTLEQSTLVKLKAAQGGGRTPVVTGDSHSPTYTLYMHSHVDDTHVHICMKNALFKSFKC